MLHKFSNFFDLSFLVLWLEAVADEGGEECELSHRDWSNVLPVDWVARRDFFIFVFDAALARRQVNER